ncbi:molybdate ABC transporter permease subunit [Parvibaculum sp.]|jgi:molybdate transport system permease protein|uniref:molybdate ABC transporter permease subunit n=1 Tax=Parvibaculum sp. TaxID=2024848 RepID=UPI001B2195FD|nr:molybdate ABC transporter permease subunit [Parvibaculum sp.]MBO6635722.1 molybdate ABC transporter permease subunit [Parvibaculum sp.]MBO6680304.1 molybdate ABC transporter permease subunit [Parvibaculum sp.]
MPDLTLSPAEAEALWLSLKTGLVGAVISLPPGLLIAWALSRRNFPGKFALDLAVHLPLVMPPVVTGYLLLLAFGNRGLVGGWLNETFGFTLAFNWKGAALAAAIMGFPLLVRALRLSFDAVDTRLEQAARTLGAGRLDTFISVTLPLILPGLVTGMLLAFARGLGEFGATITFVANIPGETQTLPIALYSALQSPDGEIRALRLLILSILLAIGALAASEIFAARMRRRIQGRQAEAPA